VRPQVSQRTRRADITWGVRQGLALTAIVLLPAAIASVGSGRRQALAFLPIAAAYLAFGGLSGVLVGIARPQLVQKRAAVAVGALLGGAGLGILLSFADPQGASRASLIAVGGVLGLMVGAWLGWWASKRADAWEWR